MDLTPQALLPLLQRYPDATLPQVEIIFSEDGEGRGVALKRSVIQHPGRDIWDVINARWNPDGNALDWAGHTGGMGVLPRPPTVHANGR